MAGAVVENGGEAVAQHAPSAANAHPRERIARCPGTGEDDLIIGRNHDSAIATLVERATRFVMLLHLPHGYSPAAAPTALVAKIQTLPEQLHRSLTWDQGNETHSHDQFTHTTQIPIYFHDPHSP